VRIHTTTRPLDREQVTVREGLRVTNATRTILDAADTYVASEQVELAIAEALERGLTTRTRLISEAHSYPRHVAAFVNATLAYLPA